MNNPDHNTIDHEGIVEQVDGELAKVRIISQSACASCHAKGACSASDTEEKFIDVPIHGDVIKSGERVTVHVARKLGMKAVAYGYFYPFLLLMLVLIALSAAGVSELRSGLLALGSLIPYYTGLFIFRKKVETKFSFSLRKI